MPFDRRTLLKSAGIAVAMTPLACKDDSSTTAAVSAKDPVEAPSPSASAAPPALAQTVLDTLSAVAARILPSDDVGPGAREANVGAYLSKTLADPRMRNLVPLMNRASGYLVRYAQSELKKTRFTDLTDDEQDEILTRMAENKVRPDGFSGPAFMQVMVALTLEGFLGDPRHGGNKDRVAWNWLGYDDTRGRAAVFGGE
jgi:gluconate 2-dehydrogenase gamma chain